EGVMAVTPGAATVDGIIRRRDRDHSRTKRAGRAGDLVGGLAALGDLDQEAGDFLLTRFAVEDPAEDFLGFGFGEMGFRLGERLHAGTLVSIPQIARKLASSAWPCSVAMLSG